MNNLTSIVSDTGPLISLEKLNGGYHFISQLYNKIIVPQVLVISYQCLDIHYWKGQHIYLTNSIFDMKDIST